MFPLSSRVRLQHWEAHTGDNEAVRSIVLGWGIQEGVRALLSLSEALAAPQEGAQQEQAACTLAFLIYAAIQTSVHHK